MDHRASETHKSVFADYERKKHVDLEFSEENPSKSWQLCEEVGRGAFAVIKKCHRVDDKNQKLFAAKLIKYEMPGDEEMSKIYKDIVKREVAMIQKWDQERLIKLYEVYIVRKYFVLFMEWVEGENLLQYLIGKQEQAEKNKRMRKLGEKDIAVLVQQLLEALKYLHDKHIAYLDIKPDNIMVQGNGKIKLVDYDNCREIKNKTGDVVDCIGTPEMTAPEGLVFENCSPATDMWAVGVLMCIMLSGESPFADPDEDEVRRKVCKVEYRKSDKLKTLSEQCRSVIDGVFKRIPEQRMKLETIQTTWLSQTSLNALRATLQVSADDYKKLKQTLEELESEEPVCASCQLRAFCEDPYDSPEEEDDEEDE